MTSKFLSFQKINFLEVGGLKKFDRSFLTLPIGRIKGGLGKQKRINIGLYKKGQQYSLLFGLSCSFQIPVELLYGEGLNRIIYAAIKLLNLLLLFYVSSCRHGTKTVQKNPTLEHTYEGVRVQGLFFINSFTGNNLF